MGLTWLVDCYLSLFFFLYFNFPFISRKRMEIGKRRAWDFGYKTPTMAE
jgi:hypothetical protein